MTMLPRLQAGEQLDVYRAVGLGSGSFDKKDAKRMLDRLRDCASGPGPRARKASAAELAAIGIGMAVPPAQTPVKPSSEVGENRDG
ncbi:MAG: hypothetical protein VYD90_13215 [Pseudomonadota bacterium]|nr:hypothetical protein [Pseudomonadota bacterium]